MTLLDFSLYQILSIALVFVWTGFVRTGLGFGGAALGLPLMLFIHNNPLLWLPIIGMHLLFFSGLTLLNRLHNVDCKQSAIPPVKNHSPAASYDSLSRRGIWPSH
jgi:uncharacterized membrane protein YfcA